MKKNIEDFDLNGKKVIIRVDFNVPIKDNKIIDDNRIKMSLKTINYAINNNAKVILKTLKFKTNGVVNPNSCPYPNHHNPFILEVNSPSNPPITKPHNIKIIIIE